MAIFSYDKEKVVSAMKDMLSATDILKDIQAEITKGYNMITSAIGSKYIKADINSINNIIESISESIEEVTEVIREKAEEIENYNEYKANGVSLVIPFEMWLQYKNNNNDSNNSEDEKNSSNLESKAKEDINDNLSDMDSNYNIKTTVSNTQIYSSPSSKNILTTNTNKNRLQVKSETLGQELKDTTNQENLQQEIDELNNKINEDSTYTTTISDNQQSSNATSQPKTNIETTQNIQIQQQSYIANNNEYNSSSITEPIVETPKDTMQSTQSAEPSGTEIEPSEGSIIRIPEVEDSSTTSTSSSGSSVISIATGITAAVVAGIGTKIYFDKKKENEEEGKIEDNEDESSELHESSIIESDYDNSTTEDEITTSSDEYSYKIKSPEDVEHYHARTEEDLANLQ